MNKLTLDCLMEVLRDASNDKNTLVHIATDLGLSSTHPGILTDKIRKMKAKAADYDTAQETIMNFKNMLREIRDELGIGPGYDTIAYVKSLPKLNTERIDNILSENNHLRIKVGQLEHELKMAQPVKRPLPELYAVIDNLMKENLDLKLENVKLEIKLGERK